MLSPELRIVFYLVFTFSLFIFPDLIFYGLLSAVLLPFAARLPRRTLKAGWIPISIFLFFTFLSNSVNHHGKILFSAGPLFVSQEGLHLAAIRTTRVILMIGGVKMLMAATPADAVVKGLAVLLKPLEKARIPVNELISAMGLTLKCFPVLQERMARQYAAATRNGAKKNLREKARVAASFLMPLFVESIRAPETFFQNIEADDRNV